MTRTKTQKAKAAVVRALNQRKAKNAPKTKIVAVVAPKKGGQPRKASRRPTMIGKALREGGSALGGMFGMGNLGTAIGSSISRIFGQGDYTVTQNSFMANGVPSFSTLEAPFRFKHKELIGVVSTATQYSVIKQLQLNPGLMTPILSSFAANFTMYKFHGLVFVFNSTSATSTGTANTSLGVNGMVVNYDPTAPIFTNRSAAEQYVGCQSGVISANLMLPVECKPNSSLLEKRFVRTGALTSGKTIAECDLGLFQFFSDGVQAASQAGELWVTYDVEFYLPKTTNYGSSVQPDAYISANNGSTSSSTFLNLKPLWAQYTSIGPEGNLYFNQPGTYHIWGALASGGAAAYSYTATLGNGAVASYSLADSTNLKYNGLSDSLHFICYAISIPTISDPAKLPYVFFNHSGPLNGGLANIYRIQTSAVNAPPINASFGDVRSEVNYLKDELADLKKFIVALARDGKTSPPKRDLEPVVESKEEDIPNLRESLNVAERIYNLQRPDSYHRSPGGANTFETLE